jgi:hypothetical protein
LDHEIKKKLFLVLLESELGLTLARQALYHLSHSSSPAGIFLIYILRLSFKEGQGGEGEIEALNFCFKNSF